MNIDLRGSFDALASRAPAPGSDPLPRIRRRYLRLRRIRTGLGTAGVAVVAAVAVVVPSKLIATRGHSATPAATTRPTATQVSAFRVVDGSAPPPAVVAAAQWAMAVDARGPVIAPIAWVRAGPTYWLQLTGTFRCGECDQVAPTGSRYYHEQVDHDSRQLASGVSDRPMELSRYGPVSHFQLR